MAEKNNSVSVIESSEEVLAEIAAKHVKKLARAIDEAATSPLNRSGDSKLPGEDLGKEMLSQQMVEKNQIDEIVRE